MMLENYLILAVVMIVSFTLSLLFTMWIDKKTRKKLPLPKQPVAHLEFDRALAILNMVALECIENRKFSLRINEKTSVPPLDEEIIYMTEKIIESLGASLMVNLERHISKKFLISYTARLVREYCQAYIEEIRFGDKK